MSLRKFKQGNLGKKLAQKEALEKELEKVGDEIKETEGEIKVKIKRVSLKKNK